MTEPVITEIGPRKAAGFLFDTTMDSYNPRRCAAFWVNCKFNVQISQEQYNEFATGALAEIGLWRKKEGGGLEYFHGSIVDDYSRVCEGATRVEIPGGLFAVFTTPGLDMTAEGSTEFLFQIMDLWEEIYDEWLEENGEYELDETRYAYEFYGQASNDNKNIKMDIILPVRKRN
ncbi:MAG: GyrI-like domain-containing protein [Eubacteriaceae bacterium]|nr:GyrI-like domain-containing protein [Eubacteriaceae bacterium]